MWRLTPRHLRHLRVPKSSTIRPVPCLLHRPLFTDEFFRSDVLDTKRRLTRLFIHNNDQFKTKLRQKFEASGLQNVSSQDIHSCVLLAASPSDTQWMGSLILAMAQQSIILDCTTVYWFMLNCLLHQDLSTSRALWQSEAIQMSRGHWFEFERKRFQVLHFTLLYRLGRLEELLTEYKRLHEDPNTHVDCSVLAMAAWLRRGTRTDWDEANQFFQKAPLNSRRGIERNLASMGRAEAIYIYFCIKSQEYTRAHDMLRVMPGGLDRNLNLQLLILTEVGQLEEAMFLLRSRVLSKGGKKSCICYPIVTDLVQRIKAETDETKRSEMLAEVTDILKQLDGKAKVLEATVEDHFIMAPIMPPRSTQSKERPMRRDLKCRHNRTQKLEP